VIHAQTSAPARLKAPAISSHLADTVGGAEPGFTDPRFTDPRFGEEREEAGARPDFEDFALLIFACLQVQAQDYANWATTFTAKRAAA
jgi:hypothetical protein